LKKYKVLTAFLCADMLVL